MSAHAGPSLANKDRPRAAWQQSVIAIILSGALGSVAWGLATTPIVTALPWPAASTRQIALLALAVLGAAAATWLLARVWRVPRTATLSVAALAACLSIFGLLPSIVLVVFLTSSAAIGSAIASVSAATRSRPLPLVFLVSGGAAVHVVILDLIAPVPINTPIVHAALLLGPLAGLLVYPRMRQTLMQALRDAHAESRGALTRIGAAGFTGLCFVVLLHALFAGMPERYWDAMVMHLYIPSYVAGHRTWSYDPAAYVWALFPAGVDWVYTAFFLLSGELGARLYNLAAFVGLCAVLYACLRRIASSEAAIWIVVLFASMPIAFLESSTLFIEHSVALWITAAVGLMLVNDFRIGIGTFSLVLALLAAAGVSKLHGALACVVIGPVLLFLFLRTRPAPKQIACAGAIACLMGALAAFPYLFAWIRTGNPVFPFSNDVFRSPYFPPVPFRDSRWEGHLDWRLLYDMTFSSGRYLEAEGGALGLTPILLVPMSVAGLIVRPQRRTAVVFAIALAVLAPVLLQLQYLRYLYPLLPLLFIPAAVVLCGLMQTGVLRIVATLVMAGIAVFNIYKIPSAGWLLQNPDFRIDFDAQQRRAFEQAVLPDRLANQFINATAGADARVLYSGPSYGALLNGTALYTDWYNAELSTAFGELKAPEQVKPLLARWRVTHIVRNDSIPKPGQAIFGQYLEQNYRPVAQFGIVRVYDLRTAPAAQ